VISLSVAPADCKSSAEAKAKRQQSLRLTLKCANEERKSVLIAERREKRGGNMEIGGESVIMQLCSGSDFVVHNAISIDGNFAKSR
jgi:hypothetical protein